MTERKRKAKRRGRGRPPVEPGGVSDVQITVRLGADIMKGIDRMRGPKGRAAFIRELLKRALSELQ